ncbi:MAG: aminotransferase class III-fold pyridoxal phosphate-dependent enzyme, partial [Cetobacterium sp.]
MKLDENLRVEGDTNLSSFRETWQNKNLSKESLRILEEDTKYFLHQSLSTPCLNVLKGSKGIYIEDLDGKLYLDFHGNNVHQVGYGNCDVIKAIKEEMDSLPFSPRRYTNEKAVALAKKLTELAPKKLNKILLTPGATSAIGMAMKLAKLATGKHNFISFWDSFHGASMDALSVGGEEFFRKGLGPMIPGCEHIIPYNSYRPLFGNSEDFDLRICEILEYTIEKQGE